MAKGKGIGSSEFNKKVNNFVRGSKKKRGEVRKKTSHSSGWPRLTKERTRPSEVQTRGGRKTRTKKGRTLEQGKA